MICRITRYKLKPGMREAYFAADPAVRERFKNVMKPENAFVVELGGGWLASIVIYADEAAAKAGDVAREALFAQRTDYVDAASIETQTGRVIWRV